jgi:hypothetical protein
MVVVSISKQVNCGGLANVYPLGPGRRWRAAAKVGHDLRSDAVRLGARASVWVALACAALFLPVATARAEQAPKPAPQQLWKAFPLDSTRRQQQRPVRPSAPPSNTRAASVRHRSGWWDVALIAFIVAEIALAAAAVRFGPGWRERLRTGLGPPRLRPRNREKGTSDVLDNLIEVLRGPFQAVGQRRFWHRLGGSNVGGDPDTPAALGTLAAWTAGDLRPASANDTAVLKSKLTTGDEPNARQAGEGRPSDDVDLLKAKLRDESEPRMKTEGDRSNADDDLAAKLRRGSPGEKRLKAPQPPASISVKDVPPSREPGRDTPPLLVIPTSAASAKPQRQAQLNARRRPSDRVCTIQHWRGHVKSMFYASAEDDQAVVAKSRPFRSRGGQLAGSDAAVAAHRELVARLEQDGWVAAGKGEEWYELRLRRPAVPAGSAAAGARRLEREEHHV